jgi:hypothetical protein
MDTLPVLEVGCEGSIALLLWVTTVMFCGSITATTRVGQAMKQGFGFGFR